MSQEISDKNGRALRLVCCGEYPTQRTAQCLIQRTLCESILLGVTDVCIPRMHLLSEAVVWSGKKATEVSPWLRFAKDQIRWNPAW